MTKKLILLFTIPLLPFSFAVGQTPIQRAEEVIIQAEDRVAILGSNSAEWIIRFWAAVYLEAIPVGLNAWWKGPRPTSTSILVEFHWVSS